MGGGHSNGLGKSGTQIETKLVEEVLVETAKEAERQKMFIERESSGLKHRLKANKSDVDR